MSSPGKLLLAKWACVCQEWPNQLETLISTSVGPGTAWAMIESRQQEQGCCCKQGTLRYEVCRHLDYV